MRVMEVDTANILIDVRDRHAFRAWLEQNSATQAECWVVVKRGRPTDEDNFWYLDAVEEALCFGWVDSIHKEVDGVRMQRFTPRKLQKPQSPNVREGARESHCPHEAQRDVWRMERLRSAARLLSICALDIMTSNNELQLLP